MYDIINYKAPKRLLTRAKETTPVYVANRSSKATKRLFVRNIPRTITNKELIKIVEEYGATEEKKKGKVLTYFNTGSCFLFLSLYFL